MTGGLSTDLEDGTAGDGPGGGRRAGASLNLTASGGAGNQKAGIGGAARDGLGPRSLHETRAGR
jgi:hypothetical protein